MARQQPLNLPDQLNLLLNKKITGLLEAELANKLKRVEPNFYNNFQRFLPSLNFSHSCISCVWVGLGKVLKLYSIMYTPNIKALAWVESFI